MNDTITVYPIKFKDLPIGAHFIDAYDDECTKASETSAYTPCCARGFTAGFRLDETVWIER